MAKLEFNYKGFRLIAQSTQDDLLEYLAPQLETIYGKDNVDLNKDYLFARGGLPVMLVAHMDTVHRTLPTDLYYDAEQGVMWSPQGIGGDDRCGVYGIITIIKYLLSQKSKLPSVMFTTFEETGCIGAGVAAKNVSDSFISHINYAIQLDRRGKTDCVFYQCHNYEFQKMVEKYGFITETGSFTDIGKLCPAWGIAGVNLSIGYLNEHTANEIVHVPWMMDTLERVLNMLDDSPKSKKYPYSSSFVAKHTKKPAKYFKEDSKHGSFGDVYWVYEDYSGAYRYYSKVTGLELSDAEVDEMFANNGRYKQSNLDKELGNVGKEYNIGSKYKK